MRNITVVIGAEDVRDVLTAWSAAGLVDPFLWWEEESAGRHLVRHLVRHSRRDTGPVPLLDALAATRYDRVRLLCLQTLPSERSPAEASLRVKDLIERHLGRGQRLSTVGVLVPATGVADVPSTMLSNRWNTIAIAVDQDGVDPHHSSRGIHSAEDLAAHAALTVATVGGLWPGMADAPFDDDVAAAGHQEPRVRLVRAHARAIRSDSLAGQIVRTTLHRYRDPEWMAARADALLAPDPHRVIELAAAEFLEGPGARLRRTPPPGVARRPSRLSLRRTVQLLWLFARGRYHELHDELDALLGGQADDRVEQFVQRIEVDAETGASVKFDGRELAQEKLANLPVTKGTVDLAGALVTGTAGPTAPGGFAPEWKSLRELSFGLADSGPLPAGCTEPASGTRRSVVTPAWISPPPNPEKSLWQWHRDHPGSLLTRIGTRLHQDAGTAKAAFLGALDRVRDARASLSAGLTSHPLTAALWRAWVLVSVVTAIVVIGALVAGVTGLFDWPTAALVSGCAVACFTVASAVIVSREIRSLRHDAYRLDRMWAEYDGACRAAGHEAAELIRLTAACAEYTDVAAIISMVTHVTGDQEIPPEPPSADLAALPRPWAFGVASTEIDPATLARLASMIGGRCFTTGWLSALYADTTAKSMSSLGFDRGLTGTDPRPDPDHDPLARRALCTDLLKGAARETLVQDLHALVVDELPGHGLDELFPAVRPVGAGPATAVGFLTGLRTTSDGAGKFNSRYWNAASGYRAVAATTRIWLPGTLGPEHTAGATAIGEPDLGAEPVTVHSARLDTTPPMVWSDLALFACAPPAEDPPAAVDLGEIG